MKTMRCPICSRLGGRSRRAVVRRDQRNVLHRRGGVSACPGPGGGQLPPINSSSRTPGPASGDQSSVHQSTRAFVMALDMATEAARDPHAGPVATERRGSHATATVSQDAECGARGPTGDDGPPDQRPAGGAGLSASGLQGRLVRGSDLARLLGVSGGLAGVVAHRAGSPKPVGEFRGEVLCLTDVQRCAQRTGAATRDPTWAFETQSGGGV